MEESLFDIAVIGGGINGAGIARDAAGRGASVLLLEAGDLASGTSSASTKLIHGGLRYLEHREVALVREALQERERLWGIAPHIIAPLRFVLPQAPGLRPAWLLRLGLFLYDHIGGRQRLPATQTVHLPHHPAGAALKPDYKRGFIYADCRVDDARLVVLNARDAADRGAQVRTRCPVQRLTRQGDTWRIDTPQARFQARAVVNAAGPWVTQVLAQAGESKAPEMRLVRGSHIVVPKLFDHPYAYLFQLADGRVMFAIPYEQDYTLIGTTDRDHTGALDDIQASAEEIVYLCDAASTCFRQPVTPAQVVWTYAGVRPLIDDHRGKPEAATRGYRFDLSPPEEGAPLLSVFGGKITTYRHLAEAALRLLATRLPLVAGPGWTDKASLPGGDFPIDGLSALVVKVQAAYPFLPSAERLARAYGTQTFAILGDAARLEDCGQHFGHGLTERELRHLVEREWARSAQDVLWRRSKLGLRFDKQQTAALADWLGETA